MSDARHLAKAYCQHRHGEEFSFAEIDKQHAVLLPARTVMQATAAPASLESVLNQVGALLDQVLDGLSGAA